MTKGLIAFMVLTAIAFVLVFMKRSADITRRRSNQIMEEFETINRNLHKTGERFDSLKTMHIDSLIKANK